MSKLQYRSYHIPLEQIEENYNVYLIPDRANALFNLESNDPQKIIGRYNTYIIQESDEFAAPTLSFKFYGTMQYWWFICMYNGIVDPTTELFAGREIKVPEMNEMKTYLANTEKLRKAQNNRFVLV